MKTFTAAALWLIIAFSIVTMWSPARWPVSVAEIGVFAVMAMVALACAGGWQRLTVSPLALPLAGIVLWGLLQLWLGHTVYTWRTKTALVYWSVNGAVFFAALQAFADVRARRWFLNALTIFACFVAILGWAESLEHSNKVFWFFPLPPETVLQFGPFPYRNQYAAFVELLLPVAIFRAMTEERRGMGWSVATALLYSSVIASASRMGFFLATGEMLVTPVLVAWNRRVSFRRIRSTAGFFLAILTMLAVAAGPGSLLEKFETRDPYAGRREYTEASVAMIRDRPAMGFGLGTWSSVYPGYAQFDDGLFVNQAHNDWAQWAAEGGLPFAAMLLVVAGMAAWRGMRKAWGVGVAGVFVHCLVDYPIQRIGVALVMFAMLAAVASEDETAARSPRSE